MDYKELIESEINTNSNSTGYNDYRSTCFFQRNVLNKNINDLKGVVENKKKFISFLNTQEAAIQSDNLKNKKGEISIISMNNKSSRSLIAKSIIGRSSSMSDILTVKQSTLKSNKNESISEISQHHRNPSISFRDNASIFNNQNKSKTEPNKIDFIFKRIFDRKLYFKLNPAQRKIVTKRELEDEEYRIELEIKKKISLENKSSNYIEEKIKSIKNKIYFMKGVLDYSYPKIMVNKFKQISENLSNNNIYSHNYDVSNKSRSLSTLDRDKLLVKSYSNLRSVMIENEKRNESVKKSFMIENLCDNKQNIESKNQSNQSTQINFKKYSNTNFNFDKTALSKFRSSRLRKFNMPPLNNSRIMVKKVNPININSYVEDQIN